MNTKLTYEQWKREIDRLCWAKIGMCVDDLDDVDYRGMYEDGVTPRGAASRAIKNAKEACGF